MPDVTKVVQWRDRQGKLHETEERAAAANEARDREVAFRRKVGAVEHHIKLSISGPLTLDNIAAVIVRDWADMVKAVEWCPPYGQEPWGSVAKLVKDDRVLWMQPQVSECAVTRFIIDNWSLLRQIMEPK